MRGYSGAVAARPRTGFVHVINRCGPHLVLTRVEPRQMTPPPRGDVTGIARARVVGVKTGAGALEPSNEAWPKTA